MRRFRELLVVAILTATSGYADESRSASPAEVCNGVLDRVDLVADHAGELASAIRSNETKLDAECTAVLISELAMRCNEVPANRDLYRCSADLVELSELAEASSSERSDILWGVLTRVANTHELEGRYARAEAAVDLLLDAIGASETEGAVDSRFTLTLWKARLASAQSRYDDAFALLRKATAIAEGFKEPSFGERIFPLLSVAEVYGQMGEHRKAAQTLREAEALAVRLEGPNSLHVAMVLAHRWRVHRQLGETAVAGRLMKQIQTIERDAELSDNAEE